MGQESSTDLETKLQIETWNAMTDDERATTARAVIERFHRDTDLRFREDVRLIPYGPKGRANTVAVLTQEDTEMAFSLVPTGMFRLGLPKAKLDVLDDIVERQDGSPKPFKPYGVVGPYSFLEQTSAVPASSFLIAQFPLTLDSKVGRALMDQPEVRLGVSQPKPGEFLPIPVEALEDLFAQHGWAVPNLFELEWAIGAGSTDVFYWGDELDYAALNKEPSAHPLLSLSDIASASWPESNAFGLRGAVAIPQWCYLPTEEGKRLYVRGGAGYCAPWQACGELLWMVNSAFVAWDQLEEHRSAHGLRPVIHLPKDQMAWENRKS